MQKNLKRKKKIQTCAVLELAFIILQRLIYIPNINKFSLVTESHNMGFRDVFKGSEVCGALNDLHVFTLSISTGST